MTRMVAPVEKGVFWWRRGLNVHSLSKRRKMLRRSETGMQPVRGIPFARFVGDLERKRILLLSTSGIVPRLQEFEEPEKGYYLLDQDIQLDELYLPKRHFQEKNVDEDLNCLFPIDRLRELASEGIIQAPAEKHVSVYGFHLVIRHIRRVVAPLIAEEVEAVEADGVIVLSGCVFCHRIAAIVQKTIEDRGIPTVAVSQYPRLTYFYGVSRILYPVGFRPGHAVGLPNRPEMQRRVLLDALNLLVNATEPLTLVQKHYEGYPEAKSRWSIRGKRS